MQDIALWEATLARYQSPVTLAELEAAALQSMRRVSAITYKAELEDGVEMDYLRALVTLGLRSVRKPSTNESEDVALFTLEATFAIDYQVLSAPPADQLQFFIENNCVHNAWPFWRQHVYDTLKRASLPVPAVPLYCLPAKLVPKSKKATRRA
jgi:hypothetical protein